MYEHYFAFKRPPFSIAPNPHFLYPSPQHKEALDRLLYGLKKEGGFIVLTGEVGTGKTTLCRYFVRKLPDKVKTAVILQTLVNVDDLLSHVCKGLGVELDDIARSTQFEKTEAIHAKLLDNFRQGKRTLMVFEEAQDLAPEALEVLRLLTNLETDTHKLAHILLIGQPELNATLNRPDLRQLSQRILSRIHLKPLSLEETENYVTHRLTLAGGQADVFKSSGMKALFECSDGIPRLINLIADRALLNLYNDKAKHAGSEQVRLASQQVKGLAYEASASPLSLPVKPLLYVGLGIAGFAAMFALGVWWQGNSGHANTEVKAVTPAAETHLVEMANTSTGEEVIQLQNRLLSLWGVDSSATDPDTFCSRVENHELRCLQKTGVALEELQSFNHPALVSLKNPKGLVQKYLLSTFVAGSFQLVDATGTATTVSEYEFRHQWQGDLTLLWRPAPGYSQPLKEGDKSFQTVFWLQDALNVLGLVEGRVITGGVYTKVLADKVKALQSEQGVEADGIVGPQTIMLINGKLGKSPVLQGV